MMHTVFFSLHFCNFLNTLTVLQNLRFCIPDLSQITNGFLMYFHSLHRKVKILHALNDPKEFYIHLGSNILRLQCYWFEFSIKMKTEQGVL